VYQVKFDQDTLQGLIKITDKVDDPEVLVYVHFLNSTMDVYVDKREQESDKAWSHNNVMKLPGGSFLLPRKNR